MTHAEVHMAVRTLLRGSRHQSFQVGVTSTEHHPNRIGIEYVIEIGGMDRVFRSADPKRLIAWVREAVKNQTADVAPAELVALGAPPRLRRVK